MSHIATIATAITDLEAVKRTCAELGLVFHENQTTCDFWESDGKPQQHPCTHAISLPVGTYRMELGLVKTPSGYDLVGDELLKLHETDDNGAFWCKHIMGLDKNPLGRNFGKFLQLYGIHKATIESQKRGYLVTRKYVPNTTKIQLVVTGV